MDVSTIAEPITKKTSRPAPLNKKKGRSLFYRIAAWLHLWLGLVTGIIMLVVCLTAATWVFNDEIMTLLQPETKIPRQEKPVLTPTQLRNIALLKYPGKKVTYSSYQQGKAAYVNVSDGKTGGALLRIDPYNGTIVNTKERKEGETDFFRTVLNGHRFLWLPSEIGRPIVNYSTMVFVIILITGMIMWWPRKWNKTTRQQSFKIKWGASFKRVNYDLHNVLGFYTLFIVAAMALTGMVYGLEWYSKGLYWVTSGGDSLPKFKRAESDSLQAGKFYTPDQATDIAWNSVMGSHPEARGFYCSYPDPSKPKSGINITIYPTVGKYYNNRSFAFDQHTAKRLPGNKVYDMGYEESPFGAKLRRMNYDIHVGSILGLPGKFIAFFGALIGASLPITGFLVWLGKKKKSKKVAVA